MEAWSSAVLEWVNCLDILDKTVESLKELRDCTFYSKLIKTLSRKDPVEHDLDDKDLVFKFIQDEYPEFFAQSGGSEGSCTEIHVASLLLIHSSHEPKLHRPMCMKLSNETQIKIKSFLEKVLQYGSDVRREDIDEAIMETTENVVKTPPVTPKMRPLKDFFNSPVTTVRKNYSRIMDERTRELRRLKAELETERFEKADLQEDLEVQREKVSNLQRKLQDKIEEIKQMRQEPTRLDTPQTSKKKRDVRTPKNRVSVKVQALMDEIQSLQFDISNLQEEKQSIARKLASTERHCATFKERSNMNERNLETLLLQVDMKDREIEGLKVHNEELRAHIQEMRRQTIEDQSFEMEMTTTSESNSILNNSEALSSVIDIQLQEAKEESKLFKLQLEDLRCRLKVVQGEYEVLQFTNKTLKNEVSELQSTRKELSEVKKELDDYIEKSSTFERESLHFKEESTKFRTLLLSKEKSLQQSEHQNENLKDQLSVLEDKLEKALVMLSQESTRVKTLEAFVTRKNNETKETLERECLRFKDLEEKYEKLKQQEAELQGVNENLRNSVSSKVESLAQAEQLRKTLKSNVHDFEEELKTVKHSLRSETTHVEELQSVISRVKLENEETLKRQFLNYQKLEKKYVTLDEERLNLLNNIEELKKMVSSKEQLLEKSRGERENLESKLEDVTKNLRNVEDVLCQEKIKVEDLESALTLTKRQKKEALESQMQQYRDIEEKYVNLELENSNLLTQIMELKILIASKEELIKQLQQQNMKFDSDSQELNRNLKVTQELLSTEKAKIKDLEFATREMKSKHEDTIQGQLLNYRNLEERYVKLEQEKISLLEKNENLNNTIESSNDLIDHAQQQNEKLSSDLQDLFDQLRTVQDSLAGEKIRVKELESAVTEARQEKKKALGSQLSQYQDLQGKYIKLEQKNISLSQKNEDLNRTIVLTNDLLKEAQQQNGKLSSDLTDLNDQLKTVQVSLAKETIRVKKLESAVTQVSQEKEEVFRSQLLKYQDLQEEYVKLDQKIVNLSQENKDLNNTIVLSNNSLKQAQQQNERLSSNLQDLNDKLRTVQDSFAEEKIRVKELESAVTQIRQEKEEISGSQLSQYQDLQGKYVKLEQEKVELKQKNEDLNRRIASKIELLEQAQQQNNRLLSNLEEQNDKLRTALDSLAEEKNKIKEFESVVSQTKQEKEEIFDLQLLKYQDLQEKYVNLEQEKLDLLQNIIDMNHSLATNKDILTQSQKNNEKLERNLQKLNDELRTTQSSLAEEKTKVEALESTVNYMNEEKEEAFRKQSTSYQALEEKYMNLMQEKSNMLKESEDLKTQLASKLELLHQSEEQKAKLNFELHSIHDKLRATQNELSTAMIKVKISEDVLVQTKLEMAKIVETQSLKSETLERSCESLRAEISSLKNDMQGLCETEEKFRKQSEELNREKFRLLRDIQELEAQASLEAELLKKTRQQNEDLESKLCDLSEEVKTKNTRVQELESLISETDRERRENLGIIEGLKFENTEHKNLIQSCSLILTDLLEQFGQITGDELTDIENSTLLDLFEKLKTLINSMEVNCRAKDSDLKSFKATMDSLNLTVSKLKTDVTNFEKIKAKDDQVISQYSKEIADLRALADDKKIVTKEMDELRKELSDAKSKTNILNEEKKLFSKSLIDAKRSLKFLKDEKITLLQNVRNQNEDFLIQMASVSEAIAKLVNQISLKNDMITNLCDDKTLITSKYEEEKKVRADLEGRYETVENDNKSRLKEIKELKDKLNTIRVRNTKLEKNLDELRKEKKRLETEKQPTEENAELVELKNCIAKLQFDTKKLEAENVALSKRPSEQEFDARLKEVHSEYDQKLERIKQIMKSAYNEQVAKVKRDQERLLQEKMNAQKQKMEEQCRKHAEEITKYKDHVTKLSSQFWDVGEKLLVEKQQKENFAQQLQDMRKELQCERTTGVTQTIPQSISASRSGTLSLDRREFSTTSRDEMTTRTVATIKEEFTVCSRRESIQNVQTMQGMGNAFKVEDEEGEVFNTNYLADMKAGRCSVVPDLDRLSVLQMRNAQCKPHLKSSYPAETQFQPGSFTEEEIKSGGALEDIFNDSLSQSLLPGEKTKKRDRTQTLYKRPGPPTPSKNGGRLSLQGNESRSPSSRILKERNTDRRSTATPRRLKDLFGGNSRRQDENVTGTPNRRRLSSIFRKPKYNG